MAVYGRILLQAPAAIMEVCSAAAATPSLQGQLNPQQGQDHSSQAGSCISMPVNLHSLTLKVPVSGPIKLRLQQLCLWPCTPLLSHSRCTTVAQPSHTTSSSPGLIVPVCEHLDAPEPHPFC